MNPSKANTPYLSNLTPLRGIAAVLVVFFHADLMLLNQNLLMKYQGSKFVAQFYLMVDFFFILSGFIMFYVYGTWFKEKVQKASFWQFTLARFARIYPLHFVILVTMIIAYVLVLQLGLPIGNFAGYANNWQTVIYNLLLIQSMNVHYWHSWNYAAWSISTEWWMYMLFPFMVRPFLKLTNWGRLFVYIGCIGGYLLIMYVLQQYITIPDGISYIKPKVTPTDIDVSYQFGFVRCFCGFSIGMLVYLLYKENIGKAFLGKTSTFILICLCTIACMHFAVPDFITVSFFALIIFSGAYGSPGLDKFFSRKVLQRVGDWSFSIYMVHEPILFLYSRVMSYIVDHSKPNHHDHPTLISWLIALSFFAVSLATAAFTYNFIEVPARKWLNKKFKGGHYEPHVKPVAVP